MTQNTEQERAEFEAVASDYGAYPKAIERDAKGNYLLMHTATGWMWWQAARRAQVAQSVAGVEGGVIRGEPTFAKPPAPPAAPQPPEAGLMSEKRTTKPEAAPVQMPDALLSLEVDAHYIFNNPPGECQQAVRDVIEWYAASVRQLLEDHVVK